MAVRADGRMACKYGHMQEGVVVEAAEDFVAGTRKRQTNGVRSIGKWKLRQLKRLYGDDTR
ncbi:hypothetical protein EC988_004922, partial [Linderina pennispora]